MKYNAVLEVIFSSEGSTEPVTAAEVKNWCKVEASITDDDTLLASLGKAARVLIEGYLCISLIPRTVTAYLNNSLGDIELPYGPVNTFTSLHRTVDTLDDTAITSDDYRIRGSAFKTIYTPCYDYLKAIYTAGYANAEAVPEQYKTAIKQQVVYLYQNRGDIEGKVPTLSPMVMQTLKPYRRV